LLDFIFSYDYMGGMTITRKGGKKMQVTSIELPDELYRKAKHQAVDDGISFKAVVQRALEEYLGKSKKKGGGK